MTYRHLAFVTALAVLLLPAVGQAQTYTTAWGDPDLQGIWTNVTITPLQRPVDFAGQEVLTEEEAAAFEQVTAERRVDGPARAGDPGTYNQHWFDRGTKVVGDRRTSLIIDTPDGRIPWRPDSPISAANRSEGRGVDYWNDHTDLDTGERCITDGMPHVPWVYNNNYQILQSPGYIAILHEQYNERRIITVDGSPHVEANIDQWFGDPRGHWEGDTLVVETTNFSDRRSDRWANNWRMPRPTLHMVERFRRVDANTIDYRFTVTDPTTFTQPWTAVAPMSGDQEAMGATVGALFEYACHEGNYAVPNVLLGARATDKAESTNSR
jgi:hypothetical protein